MKYRYTAAYLRDHPIEEFSDAMTVQDVIACKEDWRDTERGGREAEWEKSKNEYRQESADGLFQLMRCSDSKVFHILVVDIALEREEEMIQVIKRRLLTTQNDFFIEDATRFLADCKENCVQWILDNYCEVRDPYMQSTLCLVLGFRADLSVADFLFEEVEKFERMYPSETYEQGPLLALANLKIRYGRF